MYYYLLLPFVFEEKKNIYISMSSDSNHKVWLTVDELIYLTDAAIEERKSRRPLPASFVAARLREAIQASKSRLMVAAEQKLAHLKDKMTPAILKPEKPS